MAEKVVQRKDADFVNIFSVVKAVENVNNAVFKLFGYLFC